MKTRYYFLMAEPDNGLFYMKGEDGAFYTITPETVRDRQKGFLSLRKAVDYRRPWHKGIIKVSDKGVTVIERN